MVELPGVQRVAPVRISDDVSEQIRRLIVSQDLDEGSRLPSERELSELFGASRPTVSQALRRLSVMGMVEIRRGSGAYVLRRPQTMVTESVNLMLDLNRASVGNLMQLRLWLETVGAEQAARPTKSLSKLEIDGLTEAFDRLRDASGSASHWIAADTVFHASVVGLAGNSYLTALYESVHTAVLTYEYDEWLKTGVEPEWIHKAKLGEHLKLHEPILEAVIKQKPRRARGAVLAHHQRMLEHLEAARGPVPIAT